MNFNYIWLQCLLLTCLTLGCVDQNLGVTVPDRTTLSSRALCFTSTASSSNINPGTFLNPIPIHNFSFGIWVKNLNSVESNSGTILGFDTEVSDRFQLAWIASTADIEFSVSVGGLTVTTSATVNNPREWHHLAIAYDAAPISQNMRLFIDGRRVSTGDFPADIIPAGGTSMLFSPPNHHLTNTCLDEAAFWNRTLTDEEVLALFKTKSTTLEPSTLNDYKAWWRFGEEGSSQLTDITGVTNLTLTGTPQTSELVHDKVILGNNNPSDTLDGGSSNDSSQGSSSSSGFGDGGNGGFSGDFGDGSGKADGGLINP